MRLQNSLHLHVAQLLPALALLVLRDDVGEDAEREVLAVVRGDQHQMRKPRHVLENRKLREELSLISKFNQTFTSLITSFRVRVFSSSGYTFSRLH